MDTFCPPCNSMSSSSCSSSSASSSTSSSSSSSSAPQPTKTNVKRSRRNPNPDKGQFGSIPGRRSSMYRGVTRHRWTGRYEAHLWDKSCWNPVQNKKGRQVYLGAYDDEEAAAHTYDLAALKYWGPDTILNFPLNTYAKEYEEMQTVSKEEYLASLRRRSSGFSRGVSKYRGVARHHHNGRWEARIGRVFGNKYLYLGTYSTQEEAAKAYDMAAIEYRGLNAVTNFDISHYIRCQLPPPPPPQPTQPSPFQEPHQVSPPQIELPENANPVDQTVIIDPLTDQPWNLCMDTTFNSIHVPDIALEKSNELHDLFNDTGFEDNIEFLFDGVEGGTTATVAAMATSTGCHEGEDNGGINIDDGIFEHSSGIEGDFLNVIEDQGGECGLMEENLNSSVDSISYPFPISICS